MNRANDNVETEYIILLDDDYQPIGTAPKLASHHADTPLHLAFSCFVFNADKKLLVTRRALSKKVWPGVWTGSFCGHPSPGESMKAAIERRGNYELGLSIDQPIVKVLADYRYTTTPYNGIIENEFCPIYFVQIDATPQPNPVEVDNYQWMSRAQLETDIASQPDEYSYWFKDQLDRLDDLDILQNYLN